MDSTSSQTKSNLSSQWWRGLGFVLLATLALSLQNVIARIATSTSSKKILGGIFELGGYVAADADKLQVSLLVLLLRVSFVVPLLWLLLFITRAGVFGEVKQIVTGSDRTLKIKIVAAGLLLFLSQTGTYLAIKDVGPAIAVTVFFIYPTATTLLAWKIFGDRPSWKQWFAIGLIYAGCTWLTFAPRPLPPKPVQTSPTSAIIANPDKPKSSLPETKPAPNLGASVPPAPPAKPAQSSSSFAIGVIEAMLAGIVFAMEGILAQSCFSKMNPAVFTGMIFSVEWVALLAVTVPFNTLPLNSGLFLMGGLLSLATLSGYLFNNFGIKLIGAASVAIIGSSGPAVTSILAVLILNEALTGENWLAIILVTIGVILMNLAKATKNSQGDSESEIFGSSDSTKMLNVKTYLALAKKLFR
jgi:drug/metabolite transporter (DMT)-like permease